MTHHWKIGVEKLDEFAITIPVGLLIGLTEWHRNEARFDKLAPLKPRNSESTNEDQRDNEA